MLLISDQTRVNNAVAFTASPLTSRTYDASQTVIFDVVLTNIGAAFDPEESVFTCPVTGLYLFSITIHASAGQAAEVQIEKQGISLVQTYTESIHTAANMAFVQCAAGEGVSVKTQNFDDQEMYADFYSTFSGMLVSIL